MDNSELTDLKARLRSWEYSGVDIKQACAAIEELIVLRTFRNKAFLAHPNLDLDIELVD